MFMNMELEKKNLKKHKYDNKNKFHASLLGNDKTKIQIRNWYDKTL